MTDNEFKEIVSDFDGFMEEHGYYTIDKTSEILGLAQVSVRQRVARGWYPEVVRIGRKTYIPIGGDECGSS